MNKIQKRFIMFIFGCILTRALLVALAYNLDKTKLKIMGIIAIIPALGWLYLYFTGSRKTGLETQGGEIWWDKLRPIHAILYLIFAYLAIINNEYAWIPLLVDVMFGFTVFLIYHGIEKNYSKLGFL